MKYRSILGTVLFIAIAAAFLFLQSRQPPSPAPNRAPSHPPADFRIDPPKFQAHVSSALGFHTRQQLEEHFDKHGSEFGRITIDQYLKLAQGLRDAPPGGPIVERVRPSDGVITRFDRKSGAFGAFNPDGTIRTFFKPNDGEAYFKRQADRDEDAR